MTAISPTMKAASEAWKSSSERRERVAVRYLLRLGFLLTLVLSMAVNMPAPRQTLQTRQQEGANDTRQVNEPLPAQEQVIRPRQMALMKQDGQNFSHCFFRTYPRPPVGSDLPYVGEVFASQDRSKVHITLENRQLCQREYQVAHNYTTSIMQPMFRCIFEVDGSTTLSQPIYVSGAAQAFILVTCPVPLHLRKTIPADGAPLTRSHLTLVTLKRPNGAPLPRKGRPMLPRLTHLPICSHAWPADLHAKPPNNKPNNNNKLNNKAIQDNKRQLHATPSPPPKRQVSVMTRVSVSYQRGTDHQNLSITQSEFVLWLEYHLALGVEHFYIYDDSPASNTSLILEWCQPYIAKSLVTYVLYPYRDIDCDKDYGIYAGKVMYMAQFMSFSAALRRYESETEWLGHWDVDEFLALPEGMSLPSYVENKGSKPHRFDEIHFITPTYGKCKEENNTVAAQEAATAATTSQQNASSSSSSSSSSLPSLAMESQRCMRVDSIKHNGKGLYRTESILFVRVHYSPLTVNNTAPRSKKILPPASDTAHMAHFRKGRKAGTVFPHRTRAFERWIDPMKKAMQKALQQ